MNEGWLLAGGSERCRAPPRRALLHPGRRVPNEGTRFSAPGGHASIAENQLPYTTNPGERPVTSGMDLGMTPKVKPLVEKVRAMVRDEIMPLEEEYEAEIGKA